MAIKQKNREAAIGTPLGEDVLLLVSMSGTEQLSQPFEFQLELASEEHQVKSSDIIGQNVTIRLNLSKDKVRYFNGFVSRFTQTLGSLELARYRATVVPWLWFLTRTADCRIFQKKKVPDIIKQVFNDHGFPDIEDTLTDSYREWEYCVQYRETDFNFVSRLMEQEGIYYFFKHDNGKHTLVLADSAGAHKSYPDHDQIKFRPADLRASEEKYISDWIVETCIQPGWYALNDFDFKNTQKDLQAKANVAREHAKADFSIYDYPGEYIEYNDGVNYAKKRIDELQTQYEAVTASSDVRGICTGCTFTLTDHPREDRNKKYLITYANYTINSDLFQASNETAYSCSFKAIDATQQFRAPRITPKPTIPGAQTAMVVGPSGKEIYTEEFGRVKVQFHWDRYGTIDENSSCWIRVAQVWAGKNWGAMYIPRKGQEVIVEFLEGDPDRPIITGRVYNDKAMPPYVPKTNPTISTIKSNSSKGGGGFNEIRFEDKKGEEQIFIHAENNMDIRVKNDRFETVGSDGEGNRHLVVEKNKKEHVKNNRHEIVVADHMEEIGKDRHLKVKGKEAKCVDGNLSLTVGGNVDRHVKAEHNEKIDGKMSLKVGGDRGIDITGNDSLKVGSNLYLSAGTNLVIESGVNVTLKVGGSSIALTSAGIFIMGSTVYINSGSSATSGKGIALKPAQTVNPATPDKAFDADSANPGEVAEAKAQQIQNKSGKYGSTQLKAHKPPATKEEAEEKKSWIDIKLLDQEGNPMPGKKYKVILPDGKTAAEGTLDNKGYARVNGIEKGKCNIIFPSLDKSACNRK